MAKSYYSLVQVDVDQREVERRETKPLGERGSDQFARQRVLTLGVPQGLQVAAALIGDDDDRVHAGADHGLDTLDPSRLPGAPGHAMDLDVRRRRPPTPGTPS